MNKADEELNIDEAFANAYKDVSFADVPDMWDRIEAGFEEEYKKIHSEEKTLDLNDDKNVQPVTMDINVYRSRIDNNRIYNKIGESAVVDFEAAKDRKAKKKHGSKWIGFAAAALLICIVIIPIAKSGLIGNDKSSDKKSDEEEYIAEDTQAENDMMADEAPANAAEVSDSADMSEKSEEDDSPAADIGELTTMDGETAVASTNADQSISDTDNDMSQGVEAYNKTATVSGVIENTDDGYILTIKRVENLPEDFLYLSKEDRILLTEGTDILDIAVGESGSYDRIEITSVKNIKKAQDTNTIGNTGAYADCDYEAELVAVYD